MSKKIKSSFQLLIKAVKGTEKNFTSGSINRALFLLAIPMILEMLMEALFAIVDIFFISQIGSEDAIATIGLTESFMYIVISVAMGIGTAATALVARRIGEGKPQKAADASMQAILLAFVVSLIFGLLGNLYAEDLLRLMGGSEEMIKEGISYTRIILTFNIVLIFLFVNNAIFRGAGDASIAMRTLWLSNGLNILLDPCLIFGLGPFPELGLEGAAIATCLGRGIGVCFQLWHLFSGKSLIVIGIENFKILWEVILKLVRLSLGGAGQHIVASASWIFLISIIAQFGSEALAGYTIAIRIIVFTILPSWGVALAASTIVGQNLGAGFPDRAEKSVWKAARINMYFLLAISILFMVIAKPIVEIFSDNEVVIQNAVLALRVICTGYIFYAYEMVIGQSFNGAGDTFTPTFLNFICLWLVQIPLAYFLATFLDLGPLGVYLSIAISSSVLALLAIYIFRKGNWKNINL